MKPARGLILIVFLLLLKVSFGQKENISALDKKISIEARSETIVSVLEKISSQTQIYFSYDASMIEAGKKIDASLTDKTIRETLDILFESKFIYQILDNQIIITKPEHETVKKKKLI